jgi:outer membrane protein OmpA-like peptidoglycan-associated protein
VRTASLLSVFVVAALCSQPAFVQSPPTQTLSAEDIIKQLAPPDPSVTPAPTPGAEGRTRSLRNLKPVARSIDMSINFEFNSAKITPDSLPVLEQLSIAMKANQLAQTRFMVEGHTDAKGSARYNLELSARRAQSVVTYLQSKGVEAVRLESVGKGFMELLNNTDPLAAENRRVRIKALP